VPAPRLYRDHLVTSGNRLSVIHCGTRDIPTPRSTNGRVVRRRPPDRRGDEPCLPVSDHGERYVALRGGLDVIPTLQPVDSATSLGRTVSRLDLDVGLSVAPPVAQWGAVVNAFAVGDEATGHALIASDPDPRGRTGRQEVGLS
jgi:hypothetical protein